MARLIQRTDGGEVSHELLFQITSIGRGCLNDVVIEDPGERRLHAEVLSLGRGRYVVRDNRSRTGVRVNGEPVEGQRELADGDILAVGPAELVLDAKTEEAAPGKPQAEGLGRGVLRLTAATLASRVLGWAREVVAMAYFGLSGLFDAYVAATTLPNLFRDVLGEQAAESAFMPAHRTLELRGYQREARRLARSVLAFVLLAGSGVVALGVLLAPWVIACVVPGFAEDRPDLLDTAVGMARVMMPYLVIIAVASVFGSLLLSDRRFFRYGLAPAAASVCLILAVVLLYRPLGVMSLAVGVVAGGVVQMVICATPYFGARWWRRVLTRPLVDGSQPALRKVGRTAIPIGLAGVLTRIGSVIDRVLASLMCPLGSISALYASFRLVQLPFGVLGLAVGRAAFPSLVEQASSEEGKGFSRAVVRAMRLNTFLMLPATLAMVLLAVPFVRLMYQRGAFTAEDTAMTALALWCYSAGLVGMGARTVLARAFYALLNTRTPFALSAAGVGINIVLSVALVLTPLGFGGLALATSIAAWCQAGLLLAMLGRELRRQGRSLSLEGLWPAFARMAASGGAMAACLLGSAALAQATLGTATLLGRAAALLVPGTVGLAAYLGAALLLGSDEARRLLPRRRRGADGGAAAGGN